MSNIIVIINTLKSGGAEKQAIILANQLSEFHNVSLVVLDINDGHLEFLNMVKPNVNRIYFNGLSIKNIYSLFSHKAVRVADVVISMLARSNITAALLGLFDRDVRILGGIRNTRLHKRKFKTELILHKYFHDLTVFNNKSGMKHLIDKGFLPHKSICIHNALEYIPPYITRKKDLNNLGKIRVLSLSRFVLAKDLITAIKAIEYLIVDLKCDLVQYFIGGYGSESERLREIILKKELSNYIRIVDSPNVEEFISNGDIFINTSIREGTSNSILEAMSFGLPVVATDAGDNSYIVRNMRNGFITEIGNYKAIAEKLKILIDQPDLRLKFGKNGYDRAKENFNTVVFVKKYLDLIDG